MRRSGRSRRLIRKLNLFKLDGPRDGFGGVSEGAFACSAWCRVFGLLSRLCWCCMVTGFRFVFKCYSASKILGTSPLNFRSRKSIVFFLIENTTAVAQ